jgi:hypothetical protein
MSLTLELPSTARNANAQRPEVSLTISRAVVITGKNFVRAKRAILGGSPAAGKRPAERKGGLV